jgi:hypothetical protein
VAHQTGTEALVPAAAESPAGGRIVTLLQSGAASAPAQAPAYHQAPAGFAVLHASWSALVATPEPLAVLVSPSKEKAPWF